MQQKNRMCIFHGLNNKLGIASSFRKKKNIYNQNDILSSKIEQNAVFGPVWYNFSVEDHFYIKCFT